MRTLRSRECPTCKRMFNDPHGGLQPARYCSVTCYLDWKRATKPAPKPRAQMPRTTTAKKRKAISEASPAQRKATAERACVYCAQHAGSCHPAHLIPKGLADDGGGDLRATVPLCPTHHRLFDEGELSILAELEPHWREHLAYAVERVGLLPTLRRVTNQRWAPVVESRDAA